MFEYIGSFGSQGFQNERKLILGFCSFLSVLCFVLFVAAASANSVIILCRSQIEH